MRFPSTYASLKLQLFLVTFVADCTDVTIADTTVTDTKQESTTSSNYRKLYFKYCVIDI